MLFPYLPPRKSLLWKYPFLAIQELKAWSVQYWSSPTFQTQALRQLQFLIIIHPDCKQALVDDNANKGTAFL